MTITIRKYECRDKATCMAAFMSNVPKYFTPGEALDFENFLERLEEQQINTQFYVLMYNSRVIGCGGFGDKDGTGEISLAWGLIHQLHQKMGFGALLLEYRLEAIQKLFPNKKLVVDTTQHSFGFFEKFGFRTTKITRDYYAVGLDRYDMVFKKESERLQN